MGVLNASEKPLNGYFKLGCFFASFTGVVTSKKVTEASKINIEKIEILVNNKNSRYLTVRLTNQAGINIGFIDLNRLERKRFKYRKQVRQG